ncbi:MAG: hypothetical protein K5768_01140 [Firmicutes bacterium]|nr:hypothetical protein [Bacillota bacterium]
MADMMSTLKGILGDDADGKIQNAMNILKNSGLIDQNQNSSKGADLSKVAEEIESEIKTSPSAQQGGSANSQMALSPEGLEFIGQIRSMVNRMSNTNDTRSDLLRSLRPFMRAERQQAIDKAIRIMNIGRFAGLLGKK